MRRRHPLRQVFFDEDVALMRLLRHLHRIRTVGNIRRLSLERIGSRRLMRRPRARVARLEAIAKVTTRRWRRWRWWCGRWSWRTGRGRCGCRWRGWRSWRRVEWRGNNRRAAAPHPRDLVGKARPGREGLPAV